MMVFVLIVELLIERCENLVLDDFIIEYSYDECDDSYYTNQDLVEILETEYLTNDENSDIINM